ncbi:MAG TPA: SsrA-binding protein SmpB [Candidatus Paceibacterota bacterium]|jgi:SsrA-binding protein|nr:SsrA-binding protein SmpB [Candidatus Paceibacterota bacterium]
MATLVLNKKASFNYEFIERLEAGIELIGTEVKSLRSGNATLEGSYIIIRGGEAFISGMTIPPYQVNNTAKDYEPERLRKLILTKNEIEKLAGIESKKGLTIVPVSMYNKNRKIKVDIAIARGKREFDKRETIKKRDSDREIQRTLKGN